MNNNEYNEMIFQDTEVDKCVSVLKAVSAATPFGGIVSELLDRTIPSLKMNRLIELVKDVDERLSNLEEKDAELLKKDPVFIDFLEEGMQQATRATSQDRIKSIGSAIEYGISKKDISAVQSKILLNLLGELEDVEIIWLKYYSLTSFIDKQDFIKKHNEILKSEDFRNNLSFYRSFDQNDVFTESYKLHLKRLGLIEEHTTDDRTKVITTKVGNLLLKSIGLYTVSKNWI